MRRVDVVVVVIILEDIIVSSSWEAKHVTVGSNDVRMEIAETIGTSRIREITL